MGVFISAWRRKGQLHALLSSTTAQATLTRGRPGDGGETALYLAALEGHEEAAALLVVAAKTAEAAFRMVSLEWVYRIEEASLPASNKRLAIDSQQCSLHLP
jgi:hypothetical protein